MDVVDLRDTDPTHGGKAWRLGAMLRAGLPVPEGVVVVGPVPGGGGPVLPAHLAERLVAVRSSAEVEDADTTSFAGQLSTELGVRGPEAVVAAVRRVAASGTSDRAVAYASRVGLAVAQQVPVIVQQLVAADVSGVLMTRDPVSGEARTVIEASWGLGPSVVDGAVDPDVVRVAPDGSVATRTGGKATRLDIPPAAEGGTARSPVDAELRRRPCLSDDDARRLAALGTEVEGLFGHPVDVEWAVVGDAVWLLQARPMTAPGGADTGDDTGGTVLVTGTGSSPGVACGPARVVSDVDAFGTVRPGDVLVCRTTDPAWTPLFHVVAAVVTETGGMLSHASIVARELGLPAVVGADGAMVRLDDGRGVTVDGRAGTVTAADPAAPAEGSG